MKTLLKFALAATIAAAALPQTASATGIAVTLNGWAHGSPAIVTINNDAPAMGGSYYAGAFDASAVYGSYVYNNFDAWCFDLFQSATIGDTVSNYTLNYGANVLGAATAGRLQTLATQRLPLVVDAASSAAFQLSVWEILYESAGNPLTLGGGNFEASFADSGAIALADAWLANLAVNLQSDVTLAVLSSDTNQDYGVFVPHPHHVPEPATTALLGLGLLGLSAVRRRKA